MKQRSPSNFSFIEPMFALRAPELPVGDWLYEVKFDGYRALAFKAGSEVQLLSRNQKNFNRNYPALIDALKSLKADFIIDGEITALDQNGRSSFQLLQSYGLRSEIPLVCYAFDLLSLDGTDLRSRPLVERRKLLAKLLKKAPENIKFSEELQGSKEELLQVARQFQLEGLTAKTSNSLYESGRRSGTWVKFKITKSQLVEEHRADKTIAVRERTQAAANDRLSQRIKGAFPSQGSSRINSNLSTAARAVKAAAGKPLPGDKRCTGG